MSQLPNDVNYSATGGSTMGAVDQNHKDFLQQLIRELGAIRAAMGCATPTTGKNAFVIGAGAGILLGSATWDPASSATLVQKTTTITVTGAKIGDSVDVSFSLDLQGQTLSAYVSANDTVTVVLFNSTAGTLDLASGTLKVQVFPQAAKAAASLLGAMLLTL